MTGPKSYIVTDEEFKARVAAMNRENPRRETAKRVADKYIGRDGGPPKGADAEIERLAKLSPIAYERERKDAAEKLGIDRLTALDSAVECRAVAGAG